VTVRKHKLEFPSFKNILLLNKCPRCGANLLNDALFCGKCGCSVSEAIQNHSSINHPSNIPEKKSLWQWISPAIWLWIFLLLINGVLGLSGHLFDISSPYYDLGSQALSALFILIPCVKDIKQLKPFLRNFGYRGLLSFLDILGALIFLFIFMQLYFKVASFSGVEKLSYLTNFKVHNWPIWSAFILICILPGIFEELAFRGYIMTSLEKVGNAREALIIQAAMFSVLHMLPSMFISHFIIGLILGIIRLRSQSLYPGMLIHTVWNAIVFLEEAYYMGALT
jgi:membrane protease YdiL (CAAX protease family)